MGGIVYRKAFRNGGDAFPLAWLFGYVSPRVENVHILDV